MGNQTSTSESVMDVVNKATTNVMMSNSSQCSQTNSQAPAIKITDLDSSGTSCNINVSNVSQTAIQTPSFSCLSDSNMSADLSSQLKSAIKNEADSAVSGIGGALNSEAVSKATTKLQNIVETNVNISNVSSCVQNNLQTPELFIQRLKSGCPRYCEIGCNDQISDAKCAIMMKNCTLNVDNISQTATQAAVANCVSKNTALTTAVSEIANDLTQSATSKNTGVDLFASLASVGGSMFPAIISIVLCIIIAFASMMIK